MEGEQLNKTISPKAALKTIFFAHSGGFSSKRVLGFMGFTTCIIIFILAFALGKEIPEFSDILITISASLVGLDSVTSVFQKTVNK